MPPRGGAVIARRKAAARAAEEKRKKSISEVQPEVDVWFKKHDTDQGGTLDVEEFKSLVSEMFPGSPPDDEMVKQLAHACGGSITRETASGVVSKYGSYVRDKASIDALFERFDEDGTGQISKAELLPLLRACAEAIPSIPSDEVDEETVDSIMATADTDGTGELDRVELKIALAGWKEDMSSIDWNALEKQFQVASAGASSKIADPDEAGKKLAALVEETMSKPAGCDFGVFGLGVRADPRFAKFDENFDHLLNLKETRALLEYTMTELGCDPSTIDDEWVKSRLAQHEPQATIHQYNDLLLPHMMFECARQLACVGVIVRVQQPPEPPPMPEPASQKEAAGGEPHLKRNSSVSFGPDEHLDDSQLPARVPSADKDGEPEEGEVEVKPSGGCCVVS